jgi:hypothetical protein
LDETYLLLKGKLSVDDDPDDDNFDDNNLAEDVANDNLIETVCEQRPSTWLSHGWIAFNLFGYFTPPKRCFSILEFGKNEDDKKKII